MLFLIVEDKQNEDAGYDGQKVCEVRLNLGSLIKLKLVPTYGKANYTLRRVEWIGNRVHRI